jgi:hypothetical protein
MVLNSTAYEALFRRRVRIDTAARYIEDCE